MNSKKILGCLGAATLAVGVSAGPVVAAGAAPSSQAVSSAKISTAKHASPARKKKVKVVFAAAPNPAGCYNIAGQVLRKGAPVPGAVVRFQSLHKGRWINTFDRPFATDANGAFAIQGTGLHKNNGVPSRDKVRVKYKKNYSKGVRIPCAG